MCAKAHGFLRGILHGLKNASPNDWGDVKPDDKPRAKAVSETLPGFVGGRERDSDMGGLLGDLNLEGLDSAQMDELGGVTDEILAA
jgi:hypothetical protein